MIVNHKHDTLFCFVCGKQLIGSYCVQCKRKRFIQNSTQYYMSKIAMLFQFHDTFILSATERNSGIAEEIVERCKFLGLFVVSRKPIIIKEAQEISGIEIFLDKIPELKILREEHG